MSNPSLTPRRPSPFCPFPVRRARKQTPGSAVMNRLICIRLFLIFVLATSTTVAQVAPSPTPPDLKTLKVRYESDLQTARQLLRARYTSALDTLVISITKSGNLDGAVAVQHESNTVKGKAGAVSTNVQVPEMNTLKSRYEADLQTASDTLQTRYITALTALQETFTKRGDLAGAIAVRKEVAATKIDIQKGLVQVTSPKAYSVLILNVGVNRLSGLVANFEWVSNDIIGWEFTQVTWRSGDAIQTVTFLESCEIYLTLLGSFKTSSNTVEKLPVGFKAKGAWLEENRQWYRVTGKKGDSFQCDGEECLIVAKSFKANSKGEDYSNPLGKWTTVDGNAKGTIFTLTRDNKWSTQSSNFAGTWRLVGGKLEFISTMGNNQKFSVELKKEAVWSWNHGQTSGTVVKLPE